ncbi:MAG: hypothetical protein QXY47_05505 [Thermoplasmata archaeon]
MGPADWLFGEPKISGSSAQFQPWVGYKTTFGLTTQQAKQKQKGIQKQQEQQKKQGLAYVVNPTPENKPKPSGQIPITEAEALARGWDINNLPGGYVRLGSSSSSQSRPQLNLQPASNLYSNLLERIKVLPEREKRIGSDISNIFSGISGLNLNIFEQNQQPLEKLSFADQSRRLVGGTVGMAGTILSDITGKNLEKGWSELLSGVKPVGAAERGTPILEKNDIRPNPNLAARDIQDYINSITKANKLNQEAQNSLQQQQTNPTSDYEILINDAMKSTQNDFDDIKKLYEQGMLSYEDAIRQANEARKKQANALYDQLVARYRQKIPEYNQQFESQKGELEQQLKEQEETASKMKTEQENTYREMIKSLVGQKQQSAGSLRNLFSSLGTAESSRFMEEMGKLERASQGQIGAVEREKAAKLAEIDNTVLKIKDSVNKKINELKTWRDNAIAAIEQNINLTEQERMAKIDEINASLATSLADLKNNYNNAMMQLGLQKAAIAAGYNQLAMQGAIDTKIAQLPYTMPNIGELPSQKRGIFTRPAGMPQDLATRIQLLFDKIAQGNVSNAFVQNYLQGLVNFAKANYPDWVGYIWGLGDMINKGAKPPPGINLGLE